MAWLLATMFLGYVTNDPHVVQSAARSVDAEVVRGCIVDDSPLTVRLETTAEGEEEGSIEVSLPWRTHDWMLVGRTLSSCDVPAFELSRDDQTSRVMREN